MIYEVLTLIGLFLYVKRKEYMLIYDTSEVNNLHIMIIMSHEMRETVFIPFNDAAEFSSRISLKH